MKKKLLLAIPLVLLLVGFLGYKMFGPKPDPPEQKISGTLVKMEPEFMANLQNGRFAKFTIALELGSEDPLAEELQAAEPSATVPNHPQNAALRAIITDDVTGLEAGQLLDGPSRRRLLQEISHDISRRTDAKVEKVMITDLTVD